MFNFIKKRAAQDANGENQNCCGGSLEIETPSKKNSCSCSCGCDSTAQADSSKTDDKSGCCDK